MLQDKHFKAAPEAVVLIIGLSAKDFITGTNVMFLLAGIYFALVAGLGEGSVYSIIGAILCFVAVGLAFNKSMIITGPWRAATAAFSLVMFAAQVIANANSSSLSNLYAVSSILINGAFLILFLGVIFAVTRDIMRKSEAEEPDQEKKESKKLTYQI
ncbi:MAG: hypothetical protein ACYCPW_09455 [Nitrososphaerales archaeon]